MWRECRRERGGAGEGGGLGKGGEAKWRDAGPRGGIYRQKESGECERAWKRIKERERGGGETKLWFVRERGATTVRTRERPRSRRRAGREGESRTEARARGGRVASAASVSRRSPGTGSGRELELERGGGRGDGARCAASGRRLATSSASRVQRVHGARRAPIDGPWPIGPSHRPSQAIDSRRLSFTHPDPSPRPYSISMPIFRR